VLLNKQAVKTAILERWCKLRGIEMTRVSSECYEYLEAKLINTIDNAIKTHPSMGKTIRFQ